MITCESCQQAFLSRKSLSPEEQRHLAQCQECRDHQQIVTKIQQNGTSHLPQPTTTLKNQLLEKIHALPSGATPPKAATPTWLEAFFQSRMAPAMVILVVIILAPMYWVLRPAAKPPISDQKDHWTEVLSGQTETVVLPDQSTLEVTGPAHVQCLDRGFQQLDGEVKATVVPGKTVFEGQTPHGRIQVLGTVFTVKVSLEGTSVRVVQGKVRLLPDSGSPSELIAGGSGIMLPSPGDRVSTFSSGHLELTRPGKDVD